MKPSVLFCIGGAQSSQETRVFRVLEEKLRDAFEVTQVLSGAAQSATDGILPAVELADDAAASAFFEKVRPAFVVFFEVDLEASAAARRKAKECALPYVVIVNGSPVASISKKPSLAGECSRQYREAAAVFASTAQISNELRSYLGVPATSVTVLPLGDALDARLLSLIATKFPATPAPVAMPSADRETVVSPAWPEGDTTVLITTAKRAGMLRTALAGIRDQSARKRIREVLVSENTADLGSLDVCREFAGSLPIRHVQRRPPITPLMHGKTVFGASYETEFVAILHDDDWWLPEHLEKSLRALEREQTVAAYSSFVEVADERSLIKGESNVMFAFAAGFPALAESWKLDAETALLSCLPGTPGRYSALVARSNAMRNAAYIFDLENHFDNDRMLTVALAKQGPLSFLPFPSVCIRMHASQDGRRFATPALIQRVTQTTEWLLRQAEGMRVDLPGALQKRLGQCPQNALEAAVTCYSQIWVRLLLKNHPRTPAALKEIWSRLDRAQEKARPVVAAGH